MDTKLTIKSIGWCLNEAIGGWPGKSFPATPENRPEKSLIFQKPFKNFGRLDNMSKAACIAVAFALRGAGLYPKEEKQPIAIFFSNPEGSLVSDTEYYKDFIEFGKTAGRANLFLYTLPTSPLGEVSVHFGLTGNIAYFAEKENPLKTMLEAAEDACEFRKSGKSSAKHFLIGLGKCGAQSAEAVFLLLSNTGKSLDLSAMILNEIPDFKKLKEMILSKKK